MTDLVESAGASPSALSQVEGKSPAEAIGMLEELQRELHAKLTAPVSVPDDAAATNSLTSRPS